MFSFKTISYIPLDHWRNNGFTEVPEVANGIQRNTVTRKERRKKTKKKTKKKAKLHREKITVMVTEDKNKNNGRKHKKRKRTESDMNVCNNGDAQKNVSFCSTTSCALGSILMGYHIVMMSSCAFCSKSGLLGVCGNTGVPHSNVQKIFSFSAKVKIVAFLIWRLFTPEVSRISKKNSDRQAFFSPYTFKFFPHLYLCAMDKV